MKVVKEEEVSRGDLIELVSRSSSTPAIAEVFMAEAIER
jgi:hypothetical protein